MSSPSQKPELRQLTPCEEAVFQGLILFEGPRSCLITGPPSDFSPKTPALGWAQEPGSVGR